MSDTVLEFQIQKANLQDVRMHLSACSNSFIPALSSRVDLVQYATKIVNNAKTFEAWDNSELIGLIAVYLNNEYHTAFITTVSVLEAYKGRNVATTLMKQVLAFLSLASYHSVTLEVNKNNTNAIRLYEKFQFQFIDTATDNYKMSLSLNTNNK